MKSLKKLNLLIFLHCITFIVSSAQEKVWNDDSQAITKIDTQQVTIHGKEFRKLVTVTYSEISQEMLQTELKQKRAELQQLVDDEKQQREYSNARLEALKMEIEGLRSFYKNTAKSKNWKDKDVTHEAEKQQTTHEIFQALKADFLENPRKNVRKD